MASRIEMSCRYTPDRDRLTVNYNSAGDTVVVLNVATDGMEIDYTWSAALNRLQDALRASVHASFTVAEDGAGTGTIVISASANFTITWTRSALRDFYGFSGNLTGASTYHAATPFVFNSAITFTKKTPEIIYSTKSLERKSSLYFAKQMRWRFDIRAKSSDLSSLRTVLLYALRGVPMTIFFNSSDSSDWSWSNFDGKIKAVLRSSDYADKWQTDGHRTVVEIPMEVDVIE